MNDISVSDADMLHDTDRDALQRLWNVLIAGDDRQVAQIYQDDAVQRTPQSGESIVGRANIAARGLLEPGERLVRVNSIFGDGGLWVSECETIHQRQIKLLVSIAEMNGGKIVRETRYRVPKHVGSRAGTIGDYETTATRPR
jgi:hypothetical protein